MKDDIQLPALPGHPEPYMVWTVAEARVIEAWCRDAMRAAVLADRAARADELAAEQRRAAMYTELVRRTAEALGVTRADGWHDLPERAAALVAEREARGEPVAYLYASIAGPVVLHRVKQIGHAQPLVRPEQLDNDLKGAREYPNAHSCIPLYDAPHPAIPADVVRDAKRYRYVREHPTEYSLTTKDGYGGRVLMGWDDLDAAVDRAMLAAAPQPQEGASQAELHVAARRLLEALDKLSDGCDEPGFRGWENGHGERVGDAVESAKRDLEKALFGGSLQNKGVPKLNSN